MFLAVNEILHNAEKLTEHDPKNWRLHIETLLNISFVARSLRPPLGNTVEKAQYGEKPTRGRY
jgi:hypothetical protein